MTPENHAAFQHASFIARIGYVVSRIDGTFETLSDSISYLVGRDNDELPHDIPAWLGIVHPQDRPSVAGALEVAARDRKRFEIEYRVGHASGAWVDLRHIMEPTVHDATGEERFFNTFQDVTERRDKERHLARLTRIHTTLSAINTMIVRTKSREELIRETCRVVTEVGKFLFFHWWLADPDGQELLLAASAGVDIPGLDRVDLSSRDVEDRPTAALAFLEGRYVVANDFGPLEHASRRRKVMMEHGARSVVSLPLYQSGECIGALAFGSADSRFFDDVELTLLSELTGDIGYALEAIAKSEQLVFLARHDPVTGLSNRRKFLEQTANLLAVLRDSGSACTIIAVNLRRFQSINNSMGRNVGDALLKQVAGRLADIAGRERVARIESDLFYVMVLEASEPRAIARAAARLLDALSAPFRLADRDLHMATRLGVATFPADGLDADLLCANAEAALKNVRTEGDSIAFFTPHLNERASRQLDLEHRLHIAAKENQFALYYQPRVDPVTRCIVGAEALLRWNDPERGLIMPAEILPALEDTGMIVEVGNWAIATAAHLYASARAAGIECPRISVNVSQVQMRREAFVDEVVRAIGPPGVEGAGIDLELTESVLADNIDEVMRKLQELRNVGCKVSIDDFGTGYSSLAYLAKLHVDALKIDRSFIVSMTESAKTMALVSTIIELAHSLQLKVVAEGVDSEEQLKLLRLLRCDEIQGYLFYPPMPGEQFKALFASPGKARKSTLAH
jgi:diguanylate cyclase (GGDEF)-like protein